MGKTGMQDFIGKMIQHLLINGYPHHEIETAFKAEMHAARLETWIAYNKPPVANKKKGKKKK